MDNSALRLDIWKKIDRAEIKRDGMIDTVGVWGPLAIPLIPAGLTTNAIGRAYALQLHFHPVASWLMGLIAGMGIEIFGVLSAETYLSMKAYNDTLEDGEERAPDEDAKSARQQYIWIVVGLLTTLEAIPLCVESFSLPDWLAVLSVIASLYPLAYLSILTANVVILRKQHKRREEAREMRKLRKMALTQSHDASVIGSVTPNAHSGSVSDSVGDSDADTASDSGDSASDAQPATEKARPSADASTQRQTPRRKKTRTEIKEERRARLWPIFEQYEDIADVPTKELSDQEDCGVRTIQRDFEEFCEERNERRKTQPAVYTNGVVQPHG